MRAWTAEQVKVGLIEAYRKAPGAPVLVPRRSEMLLAVSVQHIEWDLIAAAYWCSGQEQTARDCERRFQLLTWARAMALVEPSAQEAALVELCRQIAAYCCSAAHFSARQKGAHRNPARAGVNAAFGSRVPLWR
jgi:hypothetical protein